MREDSKEWTLVSQEHVNTKKECTQQKKKGLIYMGLCRWKNWVDISLIKM